MQQPRQEWRVVHEQQRRALRRALELVFEPGEASRAQLAARLARDHGIEADQAQRIVFQHVMQELARLRQVRVVGKRPAQRAPT